MSLSNVKWKSFGVLHIEEGDTLFVRTPELVMPAQMDKLQSMLPFNVKIIFVAPDVDIAKLKPEPLADA